MTHAVNDDALDVLFRSARTHRNWRPGQVTPQMLMAIYDLARWGPTTNNTSPERVVFVVSTEAKERLKPHLTKGNVEQTMKAPATAIIAYDLQFYEKMGKLSANPNARESWMQKSPAEIEQARLPQRQPSGRLFHHGRAFDRARLRPDGGLRPRRRRQGVLLRHRRSSRTSSAISASATTPACARAPDASISTRPARSCDHPRRRHCARRLLGGACERWRACSRTSIARWRAAMPKRSRRWSRTSMRRAGCAFSDVDRIGVTTGPGTFAGQRVGLAFARALALALKKPAIGVTTLDVMAAEALSRNGAPSLGDRGGRCEARRDLSRRAQPRRRAARTRARPVVGGACTIDLVRRATMVRRSRSQAPPPKRLAPLLFRAFALRQSRSASRTRSSSRSSRRLAPAGPPPKPLYLRPPDAKLPGAPS